MEAIKAQAIATSNEIEKKNLKLNNEVKKMHAKVQKAKNRRHIDKKNMQICVSCNLEYNDQMNFKWSCRTHSHTWVAYQGIYWCCGKTNRTAHGCKR
jgi:hypothetical protein